MAHEHCGKHDITFPPGGKCWNCEEVALHASGEHAKAYKDPKFLHARGGAPQHQSAVNAAVSVLAGLSEEQLARLVALAQGETPLPIRKPIAAAAAA